MVNDEENCCLPRVLKIKGLFNDAIRKAYSKGAVEHAAKQRPEPLIFLEDMLDPFLRFKDCCPFADLTPVELTSVRFTKKCLTYRNDRASLIFDFQKS